MPSVEEQRPAYPSVWPSLLISAFLAVVFSLAWISGRDAHEVWRLRILLAPVYIPLAFGLIWPIFTALQSLALWSRPAPALRTWTAFIVFIASAACSEPFIAGEYDSIVLEREQARTNASVSQAFFAQQAWERQQIQDEIRLNGYTAFSEPLTDLQAEAIEKFIDSPSATPADLQNLIERYPTSVAIMEHIVNKRSCPPEVLDIIYENLVAVLRDTAHLHAGSPSLLVQDIAWHPNVSVPLLTKILAGDSSGPRRAAAANPKLPKPIKIAYLKRMASSENRFDRQEAMSDPDCPPEILEQLAADPIQAAEVASNPNAPTELLQRLANSTDSGTRIRATATLAKRQATTP